MCGVGDAGAAVGAGLGAEAANAATPAATSMLTMSNLGTLASILSQAGQLGMGLYGMAGQPGPAKVPTPQQLDPATAAIKALPAAVRNQAANTGGGFAPELLAETTDQYSGAPGGGLDILAQIKQSMNVS